VRCGWCWITSRASVPLRAKRKLGVFSLPSYVKACWINCNKALNVAADMKPVFIRNRDNVPLPPKELRAAGDLFQKDSVYLDFAEIDVDLINRYSTSKEKAVLDFGSGSGRLYFGFNTYNEPNCYLGLDAKKDSIYWASNNISNRNTKFCFEFKDVYHERYNKSGKLSNVDWFELIKTKFDIIYCYSIFSHCSKDEICSLFDLFLIASKSNTVIYVTVFIHEGDDDVIINSDKWGIKINGPLHVVSYRRSFFENQLSKNFTVIDNLRRSATDMQDIYIMRPL
jgi:SAM-dependent methyltransferase